MAQKTSKQVIEVFCGANSRGWQKHCEHYKGCCDEHGWKCAHNEVGFCNFKAPIYSVVKIECVTPGWYWVVELDGIISAGKVYSDENTLIFEDTEGYEAVDEMGQNDFTFYRIPPLKGEVAE
jgi:hypothetical protein